MAVSLNTQVPLLWTWWQSLSRCCTIMWWSLYCHWISKVDVHSEGSDNVVRLPQTAVPQQTHPRGFISDTQSPNFSASLFLTRNFTCWSSSPSDQAAMAMSIPFYTNIPAKSKSWAEPQWGFGVKSSSTITPVFLWCHPYQPLFQSHVSLVILWHSAGSQVLLLSPVSLRDTRRVLLSWKPYCSSSHSKCCTSESRQKHCRGLKKIK